jgi:uncharacterized protein (DUF2249 family)
VIAARWAFVCGVTASSLSASGTLLGNAADHEIEVSRSCSHKHALTMNVLRHTSIAICIARDGEAGAVAIKTRHEEEWEMSETTASSTRNEIDVRQLIPIKRHEKIFQLVDALAPGNSFVLVNDHDPKPLYYQLQAEHPNQFSWTYVEKGPSVWRVEIGRVSKAV